MNDTVYCRLAWPKKCIISVKCVNSTTLGDTQRMLGLLGAAPGVVSYFRRKTARCVSRNGPKSDRCHLDNESPNLSGIGLRCVSCNRPLDHVGQRRRLQATLKTAKWCFRLHTNSTMIGPIISTVTMTTVTVIITTAKTVTVTVTVTITIAIAIMLIITIMKMIIIYEFVQLNNPH